MTHSNPHATSSNGTLDTSTTSIDTTSPLVAALLAFQAERHIAVSEMARLFGIGTPTLWRILAGKHIPRGQTLAAMSRAGLPITKKLLQSLDT